MAKPGCLAKEVSTYTKAFEKKKGLFFVTLIKPSRAMSKRERYTIEEQEAFRPLIEERIAQAEKELRMLTQVVTKNNTDFADRGVLVADNSMEVGEMEMFSSLAARQVKLIGKLKEALRRIGNDFGTCKKSGLLIPKERLRVMPFATSRVEVKKERDEHSWAGSEPGSGFATKGPAKSKED